MLWFGEIEETRNIPLTWESNKDESNVNFSWIFFCEYLKLIDIAYMYEFCTIKKSFPTWKENIVEVNNRKYIHMRKGKIYCNIHNTGLFTKCQLRLYDFIRKVDLKIQCWILTGSNPFFITITGSYTNCSMS